MKKIKFALVALTALVGIGGAAKSADRDRGQIVYNNLSQPYDMADKGVTWDCTKDQQTNCTYTSADLQHVTTGAENYRFELIED